MMKSKRNFPTFRHRQIQCPLTNCIINWTAINSSFYLLNEERRETLSQLFYDAFKQRFRSALTLNSAIKCLKVLKQFWVNTIVGENLFRRVYIDILFWTNAGLEIPAMAKWFFGSHRRLPSRFTFFNISSWMTQSRSIAAYSNRKTPRRTTIKHRSQFIIEMLTHLNFLSLFLT